MLSLKPDRVFESCAGTLDDKPAPGAISVISNIHLDIWKFADQVHGLAKRKLDIFGGTLTMYEDLIVEKLEHLDVTMMLMITGAEGTSLMNVVSIRHPWIASTMPLAMHNVPIAMETSNVSSELTWATSLIGSLLMVFLEDVNPSRTRMAVT